MSLHPRVIASVLTVGDELLIGQVTNTNASWMGEALSGIGYLVQRHLTVGDGGPAIAAALMSCLADSDVVIISGGLGPTDDDLTVASVSAALGLELYFDSEWLHKIEEFFKTRGRPMPENNRRQCYRPKSSERLDNSCGTAPGIWLETNGKVVAIVPGVPYEMKTMLEDWVLPRLKARAGGYSVVHRTLHTAGVGESVIAEKLKGVDSFLHDGVTLAYLPSLGEVRLRISAHAVEESMARGKAVALEAWIQERLKHIVYGFDGDTLEAAVGRLLKDKGFSIAAAESCTGGLINHKLTNVAGSSRYINGGLVAYANAVKTKELGVDAALFNTVGAVSEDVVRAMAEGVRKKFSAEVGVATSGIAGPDGGTEAKPVGTVWIAVADPQGTEAVRLVFEKDRLRNKERFASAALNLVRLRLMGVRP